MNEALETFFANPQIKIILFTAAASLTLALILGLLLGFFKKLFFVKTDPTIQAIRDALPGANCGGCGYPGCDGFADACAAGDAPANGEWKQTALIEFLFSGVREIVKMQN